MSEAEHQKAGQKFGNWADAVPNGTDTPLAIIGIASMFPKSKSLTEYWHTIKEGVDAITDVPDTHWRPEDYFSEDQKKPDFTYGQRGGFLPPYDFDPLAFGIPPNVIEATDTSQLLGMVVADRAMRDAGYGPDRDFDRDRLSVILGVTGVLELVIPLGARLGHPIWRKSMEDAGVPPELVDDAVQRISDSYVSWQENSFPGLLGNVVAGRISKHLNSGGTNCVVDAACASSLSAIHLAAMELATGKADLAISGGVDTFNDIFMYMCFSKTPALSPSGDSRPFDNDGDGTTLGEGLGMVVLKRLADAERDGDRIYAVLKGMGSSSDGKGDAIYAPSSPGQEKALRAAYRAANVTPGTIELLEAHGTGTQKGDAVEAIALKSVYGTNGKDRAWCALGSIKSQIGHTKSAAGAAGLIKAVLALHHKVLPPTLKVSQPHEEVRPGTSAFYLNTTKRPWVSRDEHPRRAGISAFGFGGTNFHAVLEEHDPNKREPDWDGTVEIVALCGQSLDEVKRELDALAGLDSSWEERRAIARRSRATFDVSAPHRLLFLIDDNFETYASLLSDLKTRLGTENPQKSWTLPKGAAYGFGPADGSLAMVFPGQGAQYTGMLRDAACLYPEMLDALSIGDGAFRFEEEPVRLSDRIYPHPSFDKETATRDEATLRATDTAQPAIGVMSLGLLKVLERFGVKPSMVAGHSYGELTALHAAGVFDERTLVNISRRRGSLMGQQGDDKGSMLAVRASSDTLDEVLRADSLDLVVANKNTPEQSVLSGATSEIVRARDSFKKRDITCTKLSVAAAFHSTFVSDAEAPFLEYLKQESFASPRIPVYSNSTAKPYPEEPEEARRLLSSQLARPVAFLDEIESMYAAGARTFVEVGPGARVTSMVRAILEGRPHCAVSADASSGKRSGDIDLSTCLIRVAAEGHEVDLTPWGYRMDPVETPAEKPRMTITISGANYRSTQAKPLASTQAKPLASTAAKPAVTAAAIPKASTGVDPQVSKEATPQVSTAAEQRVSPAPQTLTPASPQKQAEQPSQAPARDMPKPPPAKPASTPVTVVNTAPPVATQPSGTPAAPSSPEQQGALAEILRQTQANIIALQQMQERTARLHSQFLEGQQTAASTFQTLLHQQHQLMSSTPPPQATTTPAPISPTPLAEPATQPQQPVVAEDPVASPIAAAPTVTSPEASSAPSTGHLERVLLEVVSEKTGYPSEMLELDMSLDADLGIDSIKRVEILSALQERVSDLPALESDQLGAIQTIRDIVAHFDMLVPNASTDPSTPAVEQDGQPIEEALLDVVAEKTGYPPDMLEMTMNMDSDLGIDSIKRVEILSALQDRFPGLPTVASEDLGKLQTLQDVVDTLRSANVSTVAPAASGDATPDDLSSILLEIVAEKTGYPTDMLELDMSLDGDLGIDSIKRVEILSALQDRVPTLPPVESEELGKLQTLNDIIQRLTDRSQAIVPIADTSTQVTERSGGNGSVPAATRHTITRSLLEALPFQNDAARPVVALRQDAVIWVTDDGSGLSQAIVERLHYLGFDATLADIRNHDFEAIPERLDGLLVVAPEIGVDDVFLTRAFERVQSAAASLQQEGKQEGAFFATVSRLDGAFGLKQRGGSKDACSGGLAGLAKTASHEWEDVSCKAIDIDSENDRYTDVAEQIVNEVLHVGPAEVGIDAQGLYTLALHDTPFVDTGAAISIDTDDVIVLTGGARGVTAEVAVALAEAYQPTLVLLGRSAPPKPEDTDLGDAETEADIKRFLLEHTEGTPSPKEINTHCAAILANRVALSTVQRIEAAGGKVVYRSVDIRDAQAVDEVLNEVRAAFGEVTGVIHGAGVLADKRIEDKTLEQFRSVYDTKVAGLHSLMSATRPDALKFVVLFSSSTARFGRTGQVDYAMANEVLNKEAYRIAADQPDCRVVAMNWGPWAGGMVTPALAELFERDGIGLIGLQEGAEFLLRELRNAKGPVEIVAIAGWTTETTPELGATEEDSVDSALTTAIEISLNAKTFPFLESHVLDGKAVLPVAMYVEWFAHAGLHAHPGYRFHGLDQLRVFKGVVLDTGPSRPIRLLSGKAQTEDGVLRIPLELHSTDALGEDVLHARADVILTEQLPRGERTLSAIMLGGYPHPQEDLYDLDHDGILFHGAHFQTLQHIEGCSDQAIIGLARTAPRPAEWIDDPLRKSWLADPLILDSAFQLMILWTHHKHGNVSLPVSFESYRQYVPSFPKGRIQVVVQVTEHTDHRAIATIEFVNPKNGTLLARMSGYECVINESLAKAFRKNRLETRSESASDISGSLNG